MARLLSLAAHRYCQFRTSTVPIQSRSHPFLVGMAFGADVEGNRCARRECSAACAADSSRSLWDNCPQAAQTASLYGWSGAGPDLKPATAYADLLPLRLRRIPRETTSSPPPPSADAAAQGCGRPAPSPEDRHRGRTGRLGKQSGDTTWLRSAASPATATAFSPA
jgi:hypothetical protein